MYPCTSYHAKGSPSSTYQRYSPHSAHDALLLLSVEPSSDFHDHQEAHHSQQHSTPLHAAAALLVGYTLKGEPSERDNFTGSPNPTSPHDSSHSAHRLLLLLLLSKAFLDRSKLSPGGAP
jgi:hypothetical protein